MEKSVVVRLRLEMANYLSSLGKANLATKEFGRQISGTGTASEKHIKAVGQGALIMGAGVAVGLGLAAKAAIDWESAWAGVTKTVDGSKSEMAELEGGLRDLARTLPATHGEIAAVAEAAGQLGVKRDDILAFTETMVALGETTNLSADEAATSIAQIANIMGTSGADIDNFAATLVELGNNGASTEREILDMAQRLAGAGKLIGATEGEILALSNAMASMGIQAQLGGGAMSRTLLKMYTAVAEGGDALDKFAEVSGVTAQEFARTWREDPIAATDMLVQGLGRVKDSGGNVVQTLTDLGIKGTQDRQVILALTGAGNLLTKSLDDQDRAWRENTALQEEAAKRYGTTESQIQVMRNQFADLAITIGDNLLPAIKVVVEGLSGLAQTVGALPGPVIAVGTGLGVLTAAGLGAIGMAGTLGPKIREADRALQQMGLGTGFASRNLGRLAGMAGRAGLALTVLAAASAAKDIIDPNQTANVTKMQKALLDLATTGKVTGEMANIMGTDLGKLGEAVERIAAPSTATQLQNLGAGIVSLGGTLLNTELDQAAQRVDDLDKALASLAQLDPDQASAALEQLKAQMTPEAFDRLLPLLDDYKVSLVGIENAARTGATGMEQVTTASGLQEDALEGLFDELDRILDSYFGLEAAADSFQQGLNDLDEAVAQAITGGVNLNDVLGGTSDGALTLRGAMRDLVTDGKDVIQEWVEQGITGSELNARVAELSKSFRDQAIAAGVPGPVVDHYLGILAEIPLEIGTTVTANVDPAILELRRLQSLQAQLRLGTKSEVTFPQLYNAPTSVGPSLLRAGGGLIDGSGPYATEPTGTDRIPVLATPGEHSVPTRTKVLTR